MWCFLDIDVYEVSRVWDIDLQNNILPKECSDKNDGIRLLAALPKNALTLEEVERNHVTKASKPADPTMLPLPSGSLIQVFV